MKRVALPLLSMPPRDPEAAAQSLKTMECIKHMKRDYIENLYSQCNDIVEYIKICPFIRFNGRDMIYVYSLKFNSDDQETIINRTFYKSTGTARNDISIENIWFPMSDIGFKPEMSDNGIYVIIGKLEDNILINLYKSIIDIRDEYNIYCRFVTKLNTYVSKILRLTMTPEILSTLPDHSRDTIDQLLTLYEHKVCVEPIIIPNV